MNELEALVKQAAVQVVSGGGAGFTEICIMHPLDLVKTRMQLQSKTASKSSDPYHYSGIVDCMKKMYKHEGFGSYYKGILPPILAETPKNSVKFLAFEQYKKVLTFGSDKPTPLVALSLLCLVVVNAADNDNDNNNKDVGWNTGAGYANKYATSWTKRRDWNEGKGASNDGWRNDGWRNDGWRNDGWRNDNWNDGNRGWNNDGNRGWNNDGNRGWNNIGWNRYGNDWNNAGYGWNRWNNDNNKDWNRDSNRAWNDGNNRGSNWNNRNDGQRAAGRGKNE